MTSMVRWLSREMPARRALRRGPGRFEFAERGEFLLEARVIAERPGFRFGFEEEVERVDGRHVGDEVHRDAEMGDFFREDDAGEEIALRVLLPVQEVAFGLDLERVGEDGRAGMRRRTQADGLWPQTHRLVVAIGGAVGQGDMKGHCAVRLRRCGMGSKK